MYDFVRTIKIEYHKKIYQSISQYIKKYNFPLPTTQMH